MQTPCVETGYCVDCDSPQRICRITSIIHRQPIFTPTTVVIFDEDLGTENDPGSWSGAGHYGPGPQQD